MGGWSQNNCQDWNHPNTQGLNPNAERRKSKDNIRNACEVLKIPDVGEAIVASEGHIWKQHHEEAVDRRYKELSRLYHPDKWVAFARKYNLSEDEAKRQIQDHYDTIKQAVEVLKTDIKVYKMYLPNAQAEPIDKFRPQWGDAYGDDAGGSFDRPPPPPPPAGRPPSSPSPVRQPSPAVPLAVPLPASTWGSAPAAEANEPSGWGVSDPPVEPDPGPSPSGWGGAPAAESSPPFVPQYSQPFQNAHSPTSSPPQSFPNSRQSSHGVRAMPAGQGSYINQAMPGREMAPRQPSYANIGRQPSPPYQQPTPSPPSFREASSHQNVTRNSSAQPSPDSLPAYNAPHVKWMTGWGTSEDPTGGLDSAIVSAESQNKKLAKVDSDEDPDTRRQRIYYEKEIQPLVDKALVVSEDFNQRLLRQNDEDVRRGELGRRYEAELRDMSPHSGCNFSTMPSRDLSSSSDDSDDSPRALPPPNYRISSSRQTDSYHKSARDVRKKSARAKVNKMERYRDSSPDTSDSEELAPAPWWPAGKHLKSGGGPTNWLRFYKEELQIADQRETQEAKFQCGLITPHFFADGREDAEKLKALRDKNYGEGKAIPRTKALPPSAREEVPLARQPPGRSKSVSSTDTDDAQPPPRPVAKRRPAPSAPVRRDKADASVRRDTREGSDRCERESAAQQRESAQREQRNHGQAEEREKNPSPYMQLVYDARDGKPIDHRDLMDSDNSSNGFDSSPAQSPARAPLRSGPPSIDYEPDPPSEDEVVEVRNPSPPRKPQPTYVKPRRQRYDRNGFPISESESEVDASPENVNSERKSHLRIESDDRRPSPPRQPEPAQTFEDAMADYRPSRKSTEKRCQPERVSTFEDAMMDYRPPKQCSSPQEQVETRKSPPRSTRSPPIDQACAEAIPLSYSAPPKSPRREAPRRTESEGRRLRREARRKDAEESSRRRKESQERSRRRDEKDAEEPRLRREARRKEREEQPRADSSRRKEVERRAQPSQSPSRRRPKLRAESKTDAQQDAQSESRSKSDARRTRQKAPKAPAATTEKLTETCQKGPTSEVEYVFDTTPSVNGIPIPPPTAKVRWPDHELKCENGLVYKPGHAVLHKKYGLGYVVIYNDKAGKMAPMWCVEYVKLKNETNRKSKWDDWKRMKDGAIRCPNKGFSVEIASMAY